MNIKKFMTYKSRSSTYFPTTIIFASISNVIFSTTNYMETWKLNARRSRFKDKSKILFLFAFLESFTDFFKKLKNQFINDYENLQHVEYRWGKS